MSNLYLKKQQQSPATLDENQLITWRILHISKIWNSMSMFVIEWIGIYALSTYKLNIFFNNMESIYSIYAYQ